MSFPEALKLAGEGVKLLCPVCKSELIFALDLETAQRHRVPTGVWCPTDLSHCGGHAETGDARQRFRELCEKFKRENG